LLRLTYLLTAGFLLITLFSAAQSPAPAVRYSKVLLLAIRDKQPVNDILQELWQYPPANLWQELSEDKYKKSFWINIYNAFVQLEIAGYEEGSTVPRNFYNKKIVRLAGQLYTLAAIEKKMLGAGGQGLRTWDYRVLFALNKGMAGSPDIVVYDSENIEELLSISTKIYLKKAVYLDEDGLEAEVPIVFKKRQQDFGGKNSVIELLRANEVIYMNVLPRLKYKPGNRKKKLGEFVPEEMLKR
jgi:hypothetical protein